MSRAPAERIMRRRFTRRDVMKVAPVAAVAGAAGGIALSKRGVAHASTTRGVCRFCLLHCGIVATTERGALVRVEGDVHSRTRGFICQHGAALPQVVHSNERLRWPLVRRGDTLHEVDWPEALATVAHGLEQLKAKYGPQSFVVQTGWPLVRHPLVGLLHRWLRAYGSPNLISVASFCEASLRMGQALTAGSKYPHGVGEAKTMVLWGANPERSAPAAVARLMAHAEAQSFVVVDPTRTMLAGRARAHLRPRPGSDGALALGLAHVLIEEQLYDAAFVEQHVHGFEAFRALAAKYPPATCETLTSVKADDVVRVAKHLGEHAPARIWVGLGVEHHENGVQTVRALSALEALTGAFDERWAKTQLTPPGESFGAEMLPALYRMATPEPVPPEPKVKPLGYDEVPLFEVYNREAHGSQLAKAVLRDEPYPVRGLMLVASNALLTSPDSQAMKAVAQKLELLVSVDPFLNDSARLADVVLPACTFAEAPTVDEATGPRRNDDADSSVDARGIVAPQGSAWPDWKIVFELSRAMGLGHYFPWASLAEALHAPHRPYMVDEAHQPRPQVTQSSRFSTPTGKVELHSTVLAEFGYPALPEWSAPTQGPNGDYPLWLVTGPREGAFINSQLRGVAGLRARVREPTVRLHSSAGFATGDVVAVVTERGRVTYRAQVSDEIHPEVVVAPFGWSGANVNELVGAERKDPISGFPALRSCRCRLERAGR